MAIKESFVAIGAAMLGVALCTSPAFAAKDCRKLCGAEIKSCVAAAKARNDCAGLKGAEQHACKKRRRSAIKSCRSNKGPVLTACKASAATSTCT